MSLAISLVKRTVFGNQKVNTADITFDSSYPTGGEALSLPQLGLQAVDFMQIAPSAGYIVEYNRSTGKLMVRTPTNESDGNAAAAAPAAEVADTTDLHTLAVRIMAYGS